MTQGVVLRHRRKANPWVTMPLWSMMLLVLGWSGLWFFGRHEAARTMDAWIESEAARGRNWSCPNRILDGFPLRIRLSCTGPSFRGKVGRDLVEVSAATVRVDAYVYQPNALWISATGPLVVHNEGRGPDTTLAWSALDVTVRGLAADQRRAEIILEDPSLALPDGTSARADRLDLRVVPASGRAQGENAYHVWLTLDQALVPALDTLTGTADPLAIETKGVLTHLDLSRLASWPELAEQWRLAGGNLDLLALQISKGVLRADARGTLRLDEAHQPAGHLDAAMAGYEPLAARLGIPLRAVAVGGVLAQLLNRTTPASPTPPQSGGPGVNVPLTLADGRVLIGPFKTAVRLPPLY